MLRKKRKMNGRKWTMVAQRKLSGECWHVCNYCLPQNTIFSVHPRWLKTHFSFFVHFSALWLSSSLHSSLLYIAAVKNANNFRTFTLTGNCCFSFNSSYKDSCSVQPFFLMFRNEVLQRLLFNLWGIELDVPPIFTEMEMKPAWMRACLSQVLIGCLFLFVL